ncbi:MAG TPA: hypothetical protein VFL82_10345 [Thermomicrobiales bacterium]|nr:hypothetical protein [Thermomicrobiales bacterium]
MSGDERWIPDHEDGSGWADVDWGSVIRGSRYHYCHTEEWDVAAATLPAFYQVVTRLESAELHPHENTYYVPGVLLADFLTELVMLGGAEVIWHVQPCDTPDPQSRVDRIPLPAPRGGINAGDD